ncbi:hypothetical protein ACLK15_15945 [Escherichia coli]
MISALRRTRSRSSPVCRKARKRKIEKIAKESGLMNAVTPQRENSMACVDSRLARWRWRKRSVSCRLLSTTSII